MSVFLNTPVMVVRIPKSNIEVPKNLCHFDTVARKFSGSLGNKKLTNPIISYGKKNI